MKSFVWQDFYKTGIKDVDLQHHKLVEIINKFGNLLSKNTLLYNDINNIFKELIAYTLFHFTDEEEGMIKEGIDVRHINYHKEEHRLFVNEITSLYENISEENISESRHLLEFLVNWLAFHILGIDQVMAQQVKDIKAGKTPAEAYEVEIANNDKKTEALLGALNTLFRQVTQRNKDLVKLNLSLEQKVKERTHELSEANKYLEVLSLTDTLTSLSNRRHAMILVEKQFNFAKINKIPLTCLMIDADNFKEVNDTFGHDSGDEVLCIVSEILLNNFRTDDNVCRLGGDEFLVICPKTDIDGVINIAEEVRKEVNTLGLDIWNSSISVGMASITPEMENFMELIKNADKALYKSKEAGKNCIRTF